MSDTEGFSEWLKKNKNKSKVAGLTERGNSRIKLNLSDRNRKKRHITKRTERNKKKVYVYSTYRKFDFMKYSLLVEHWAMVQYNWTRDELGLMFYLYTEPYFTKAGFLDHSRLITGKTYSCFKKFVTEGFIEEISRDDVDGKGQLKIPRIYRLSFREKNRIKSIYDRLLLKTKIDESNKKSKIFRVLKSSQKDKRIAKAIRKMNEDIDRIKNGCDSRINDDFIEFDD